MDASMRRKGSGDGRPSDAAGAAGSGRGAAEGRRAPGTGGAAKGGALEGGQCQAPSPRPHARAVRLVVGWALLWCWPYVAFMSPAPDALPSPGAGMGGAGASAGATFWIVSLAVLCATVVALALRSRSPRTRAPLGRRAATAWAGVLAASCVAMAVVRTGTTGAWALALGMVGAVASGVSSGCLLVIWQQALSTLSWNEIDAGVPLGYGASLALGVACASLGPLAGTALLVVLAAGSAALLARDPVALAPGAARAATGEAADSAGAPGDRGAAPAGDGASRARWVCTALCVTLIWVPLGYVEGQVVPDRDASSPAFAAAILVGVAIAALAAYLTYRRAERVDLSLAVRVAMPLATVALLALCLLPARLATVAQVLGFTANTVLHIHLHVSSASMVKSGTDDAARSSAGLLMPLYLGALASSVTAPALAQAGDAVACLVQVCVLLMVALFLLPYTVGYRPLGRAAADTGVAGAGAATPGGGARRPAGAGDARTAAPGAGEPAAGAGVDEVRSPADVIADRYGLTPRERQVLELFATGRDSGYIREHLGISRDTVNTHLKHIYVKLDIHSKRELLDMAEQVGRERS
ncbi:MAG: helix-turn-helix domain-containing protein [Coriobacteriales bacterium]|jgi:DNA-binding CsgD family transcriptional regulator